MSEQPLDLRRSAHLVRRHWIAVCIVGLLGLALGIGYTLHRPPMLTGVALVAFPPATRDVPTQVVVAGSDHVLADALRGIGDGMSPQTLRSVVQVKVVTSNLISISGMAKSPALAERIANTVASDYISFARSKSNPAGAVQAQLLQPATSVTGRRLIDRLIASGGLGAVLGTLVGALGVIAFSRRDRRLRARNEIADAIGLPVLASFSVRHPSDPARWTRMLDEYEPGVADGLRMQNALQFLGLSRLELVNRDTGGSVGILTLSSDRRALALGPQLAVYAADQGIDTALVIGPQQDANTSAALRAACAAQAEGSRRSNLLRLIVADHVDHAEEVSAALSVVVAVVDGQSPEVGKTMRAGATVLGVSSGAATAEQLARVAASAAADNRQIAGILVADPDPSDPTTGRLPQLARPTRRTRPTRINGASTAARPRTMETRR
jgi:hypothetical protein